MVDYVFFFSSRRRHTRWPRDWSSDVCSSDLRRGLPGLTGRGWGGLGSGIVHAHLHRFPVGGDPDRHGRARGEIGRASCRERGGLYGVAVDGKEDKVEENRERGSKYIKNY